MEEQTMAQEVTPLYDDMDGSPGAQPFAFSLQGKSYEINLCPDNEQAFLGMLRPWLRNARETSVSNVLVCLPGKVNRTTGVLSLDAEEYMHVATAAGPGQYVLSSPDFTQARPHLAAAPARPAQAPHLTQVPTQTPPDDTTAEDPEEEPPADPAAQDDNAQAAGVPDIQVRDWAKRHSVPNVPTRGRMPSALREVYDAFHQDNQEPWRELLLEHDIDPDKALAKARELKLVDTKKAEPDEDEVLSRQIKNVGRLNAQQLLRLRKMLADPKGRATTDGSAGDRASYDALQNRGCCVHVSTRKNKRTYELTAVGREYCKRRGISPLADDD